MLAIENVFIGENKTVWCNVQGWASTIWLYMGASMVYSQD